LNEHNRSNTIIQNILIVYPRFSIFDDSNSNIKFLGLKK